MDDLRFTVCGRFEQPPGFAGDDEFFVGGNHHHFHARAGGADDGFGGVGGIVFGGVEDDAELVEVGADGGAEFGAVFPDAGGEDQGIGAVELEEIAADPVAGAGGGGGRHPAGAAIV